MCRWCNKGGDDGYDNEAEAMAMLVIVVITIVQRSENTNHSWDGNDRGEAINNNSNSDDSEDVSDIVKATIMIVVTV